MEYTAIISALEKEIPLSLAESWDNVGTIVEPPSILGKKIHTILLCIDLTSTVMQEALDIKADMIIAYHPGIYCFLNTVHTCLQRNFCLYLLLFKKKKKKKKKKDKLTQLNTVIIVLFASTRRFCARGSTKERIALIAAENGIAVWCPHTAFDAMKGGINDWLVSGFGIILLWLLLLLGGEEEEKERGFI